MKTIIIAAGYATRLYPLTENFPKPLLKVGQRSILDRLIDDLDTIPEIDEHIIVTNHKFAPHFEEWATGRSTSMKCSIIDDGTTGKGFSPKIPECDGSAHSPKITIIDDGTSTNEGRLGAVRDLLLALNQRNIDVDIMVLAADNILEFPLRGFVDYFKEKGTSVIMCHHEPELKRLQRTGVIEVDEDMKVLQMQEKPEVPVSNWAVPPFYIYSKKDLPLIRECLDHGCGFDAPGNLARYLAGVTTLHAWPMPAPRFDIGSLDSYREACERFAN